MSSEIAVKTKTRAKPTRKVMRCQTVSVSQVRAANRRGQTVDEYLAEPAALLAVDRQKASKQDQSVERLLVMRAEDELREAVAEQHVANLWKFSEFMGGIGALLELVQDIKDNEDAKRRFRDALDVQEAEPEGVSDTQYLQQWAARSALGF